MDDVGIHEGHRERMRKRFERDINMEAFSEHEMLEYLLYYSIPRKDTNVIAHALLREFGSLSNVFNASVYDLCSVPGITKTSALLLKSITPIAKAAILSKQKSHKILKNSADSVDYFKDYFFGETAEKVFVVCLDINNRIYDVVDIGKGTATETEVDLVKLTRIVTSSNAAKVILMHNHPGGNVLPSRADLLTTNYAILMLYAHKVTLIDHLIFAPDGRYFSFFQNHITDMLVNNCNKFLSFDVSKLYNEPNKLQYNSNKAVNLNIAESQQTEHEICELFGLGNAYQEMLDE